MSYNLYPFALPTTRALASVANTFALPTPNEVGDDKNAYLFSGDGRSDRLANLLGGIRPNVTDIQTLGAAMVGLRLSIDCYSRAHNRFEHEAGRMYNFYRTS